MKILVPVKRVLDANIKVRVKPDQSGVELANVKMAMNPFCEIAVEQAIRMKEQGYVSEIIAFSAGLSQSQETLRTALAMGADRAVLVESEENLQPLAVAKLLQAVISKEEPGLVIMGKQSIDGDNNQTGQILAGLMNWSIGSFVSKIELDQDYLIVTREIDGGLEKVRLSLPCVVTVDLRLNEPRYASLPNIMKAKRKPLEILKPDDLGVDVTPRIKILKITEPEARKSGVRVAGAEELIDKLKNEAKVI